MNVSQISLPEGWFIATDDESMRLHSELQLELPPGHLLYNVPVDVIAHRDGATDDILCRHQSNTNRFTVIHLTWSMKEEYDANHPSVEAHGDYQSFLDYEASFYGR